MALGHPFFGTRLSLPMYVSVSVSLFFSFALSFFSLFVFYRSLFLVLSSSSSPTHTFRNIREHHNNSYQVPVCSMIYSRFPVKFGFYRGFARPCSDRKMQGTLEPPGVSLQGERGISCNKTTIRKSGMRIDLTRSFVNSFVALYNLTGDPSCFSLKV